MDPDEATMREHLAEAREERDKALAELQRLRRSGRRSPLLEELARAALRWRDAEVSDATADDDLVDAITDSEDVLRRIAGWVEDEDLVREQAELVRG